MSPDARTRIVILASGCGSCESARKTTGSTGSLKSAYLMSSTTPTIDIAGLGASKLTEMVADGLATSGVFFLTDKLPAVTAKLSDCVKTLLPG